MKEISCRPEELRAHFCIPAGNKTKLWPFFSEECISTICLPHNLFSFTLAEFQEGGVQFLFILQAKKKYEMGRNKAD
jgi:hypothetical protein